MTEQRISIEIKRDTKGIAWDAVAALLGKVEMAARDPAAHQKAFENSYSVVFVFARDSETSEEKMIAFGRAVSDGAYEASLYDIAVDPDFQGRGIGRLIIDTLINDLDGMNVILFSAPGKEAFYHRCGFSSMKTGIVRFVEEAVMREKGFID